MCELFAVSSDNSIRLNGLLNVFYGRSIANPHGWGIAKLEGRKADIIKEPVRASDSKILKAVLQSPVKATTLMAHIRYATIGNTEYVNCHPFSGTTDNGRRVTLMHNGTVFESEILGKYVRTQEGDTDSEKILLYILDRLNQAEREGKDDTDSRLKIYSEIVEELAPDNKLNLIFYDGELLMAHTNYRNSLYESRQNGAATIATSPLTSEEWNELPFTSLCAYKAGVRIYTGEAHGHEFIDNEEQFKLLYRAYSYL